jgi:hypothetical protein
LHLASQAPETEIHVTARLDLRLSASDFCLSTWPSPARLSQSSSITEHLLDQVSGEHWPQTAEFIRNFVDFDRKGPLNASPSTFEGTAE